MKEFDNKSYWLTTRQTAHWLSPCVYSRHSAQRSVMCCPLLPAQQGLKPHPDRWLSGHHNSGR